jgi:hypothetical protein
VHSHEQVSTFAKFEGTGERAVLVVSNDKNAGTFYVEAVSVISDAPVGVDSTLTSSTTSQNYYSVVGYRTSYAQAVLVRKFEQSLTDRDLFAEVVKGLGHYWARVYDALIANYGSAYSYPITSGALEANIAYVYNPSLAANITNLAAILNLASIGTSSAASSKEINAFFAGTAEGGGPITNPAANSWDAIKANPSDYTLTVETFMYLRDYLLERGVPPVNLDFDGTPVPMYLAFIPTPAITRLKRDPEYIAARNSGNIGGMEMWKGGMRADMINGIAIIPWDNPYPYSVNGITGGTLARVAAADNSLPYYAVESLVFGGQAIAVSSYDDFVVKKANEDDFGRQPKIGFDIIKDAIDNRRIDTTDAADSTPTTYKNTCSLLHSMTKWN